MTNKFHDKFSRPIPQTRRTRRRHKGSTTSWHFRLPEAVVMWFMITWSVAIILEKDIPRGKLAKGWLAKRLRVAGGLLGSFFPVLTGHAGLRRPSRSFASLLLVFWKLFYRPVSIDIRSTGQSTSLPPIPKPIHNTHMQDSWILGRNFWTISSINRW